MPTLELKQHFDITPKTKLPIPGDGRIRFELQGSIDVPNPLVAQQIYDATQKIAKRAKGVLQKKFDGGAAQGWSETKCGKVAASVLESFYERATNAIDKVIADYVKMHSQYKILSRQDYAKAAASVTTMVLQVTRLVISGGTDLMAWASLAKSVRSSVQYLQKTIVDVAEMDKTTRESVQKACKYYEGKYLKGREGTWDKFCKFFSDPLSNAKKNMDTLQNRLVRAEKPCHDMAEAVEAGLRLQDKGEVTEAQAKKLNQLLVAVSTTMGKVTPAKSSLEKMFQTVELLDADIQRFKSKKKPKRDTKFAHMKNNMEKKVKALKKMADERAVQNWASSVKSLVNLAAEIGADAV